MQRRVRALIQANTNRKGYQEFPVMEIESYAVDANMDTDSDAFSLDIGRTDPDTDKQTYAALLERDAEVRVSVFTAAAGTVEVEPLHWGIADQVEYDTSDGVLSIAGRDLSSIAVDADAPPGEWRNVDPPSFIKQRAGKVGYSRMSLASTSKIGRLYTDASESEWEFWYRIAREKKMWLWTEPNGELIMDRLHYSVSPMYFFGKPGNLGTASQYIPIISLRSVSNKQQRHEEVWVFGERGDIGFVAAGRDDFITAWKKKNLKIINSTTAKNYSEALQEANDEVFESIVGAQEWIITIPDPGFLIRQNNMALVNLPQIGFTGQYYIVGCQAFGTLEGGHTMQVRLREKGFAISKRVPQAPELTPDPDVNKPAGSIAGGLVLEKIRWGNAFASAAVEFNGGWPLAVFLGALLSICAVETGFKNIRGGVNDGDGDQEWFPFNSIGADVPRSENTPGSPLPLKQWRALWANARGTPENPRYPNSECAVGPMQLVTPQYKVWADNYGGISGEYNGGRWVPESNIRAGGRVLAEKLDGVAPSAANIWIGVERYYGSNSNADNVAYRNKVKREYDSIYFAIASAAVASAQDVKPGTETDIRLPNGDTLSIPENTPTAIKKAINWAFRRLGDPYQWGGNGPLFDCSSFVQHAYGETGGPKLTRTTYTQWKEGTAVAKSDLLPGDVVFFEGPPPEHEGLYLGNGLMIHDPHTGDFVKVSSINSGWYRSEYIGARRMVSWEGRGRSTGD